MRIGVIAVQGAFIEHITKLNKMGVDAFEIRQRSDIDARIDGFIIPGGESTVIGKLLVDLDMLEPIKAAILHGTPVFGTCAGLILLSKKLANANQPGLQVMDITTVRNGYGRQLGSFTTRAKFHHHDIDMVFIRAPYIETNHPNVEILAIVDDKIVAARQHNILVTAFHPELTNHVYVYEYFMDMIKQSKQNM